MITTIIKCHPGRQGGSAYTITTVADGKRRSHTIVAATGRRAMEIYRAMMGEATPRVAA